MTHPYLADQHIVFFSHDSMGIGHVRRNLALAHQIAENYSGGTLTGVLVTGLQDARAFPLPAGFEWLIIPGIEKGPEGYRSRNRGLSMNQALRLREHALEELFSTFLPDMVVIDRHLYGINNELAAPLTRLKARKPRARVILGMREILDTPETAKAEWDNLAPLETAASLVDAVWVYGDRAVHDPVATGEIPAIFAPKITYTGYISKGRTSFERTTEFPTDKPFILTTAGGGSDGETMLSAAAEARVPAGYQHLIITGPQISDERFDRLIAKAGENTTVLRSFPGLAGVIAEASAVISMGGYNTVSEILATNTPALVIPREHPRQEQRIRAEALAQHSALEWMATEDASPEKISAWLEKVLGTKTPRTTIALDGLSLISELANQALEAVHAESGQKIGYIVKVYPRFSETFVVTEILAREALGDDVSIFALRPTTDQRFHPELSRVQAPVQWIPKPSTAQRFWQQFTDSIDNELIKENFFRILPELSTLHSNDVAQGITLAHRALDEGITHFHAHFASLAGRMAWVASQLTGIPYTVTTHAKDIFHQSVDQTWLRRICADAERVIAISQFNEKYLKEVLAGTGAKIQLQYNAIELDRFPFHEPTERRPHSRLRLSAVGRLVPKKGFGDLIDAVARLLEEGVDVDLHLAGGGELEHELADQISRLGLEKRVLMLGPRTQEEIRELVAHSDVFVAPCVPADDGNIDGLPTVVLEAMALGTPVVATAVTGLPEVIINGQTGFLLEPGNIDQLVDTLRELASGEHATEQLVRGARTLIEEKFDSVKQAKNLSAWEQPAQREAKDSAPAEGK